VFKGGRSLINTPDVQSNGLSHHVQPYDPALFIPEVQKSLQKLQLLRDGISIDPIIKKIADWDSPLEQLFYATFIYLRTSRRIDPKIHIEEQYHVVSSGKRYRVDFRLSLADEVFPELPSIFAFVECDSYTYHDRTPEAFDEERERIIELQRQGGKVYPFTGGKFRKNPAKYIIECVKDLQRDLLNRRELLMQAFL
jgi:hypothetical protein